LEKRESLNYFKAFYTRSVFPIIPIYAIVVGIFYLSLSAGLSSKLIGSEWLFDPGAAWYARKQTKSKSRIATLNVILRSI
jgi:hypothetical protein